MDEANKHSDSVNRRKRERTAKVDAWLEQPDVIRRFLELRPALEQLSSEIAYTLTIAAQKSSIAVSSVSYRAKALDSFLEKIDRKSYSNPFNEITDLAGARVVCYYPDDLQKLTRLVEESFEIIEQEDKSATNGVDRFGYGGIHFLVKLGKKDSGARYDHLKDHVCEIQIRTVMQDAWSILSHHLIYKHEEEVPTSLRRSVNALAGAMDTADVAFQAIRTERDKYLKEIKASLDQTDLSNVEVNLDTLGEYLRQKFTGLDLNEKSLRSDPSGLMPKLLAHGYTTLSEIEGLLNRTEKAREWITKNQPDLTHKSDARNELVRAFHIDNPSAPRTHIGPNYRELYDKAASLFPPGLRENPKSESRPRSDP